VPHESRNRVEVQHFCLACTQPLEGDRAHHCVVGAQLGWSDKQLETVFKRSVRPVTGPVLLRRLIST